MKKPNINTQKFSYFRRNVGREMEKRKRMDNKKKVV